jgi:predicted ester cyclase
MEHLKKNNEFIGEYFNALSGVDKTRQLISKYVDDEHLIEHILFFESVFPKYELIADEITSEDNRVVIYARFRGKHLGELNTIPPTFKTVELPLAVGYKIEKNKIISHWLVINQMLLMEQLGVSAVPTQ